MEGRDEKNGGGGKREWGSRKVGVSVFLNENVIFTVEGKMINHLQKRKAKEKRDIRYEEDLKRDGEGRMVVDENIGRYGGVG